MSTVFIRENSRHIHTRALTVSYISVEKHLLRPKVDNPEAVLGRRLGKVSYAEDLLVSAHLACSLQVQVAAYCLVKNLFIQLITLAKVDLAVEVADVIFN